MFTLPDQYIRVNGYKTRYWDAGEGPIVLLVHGLIEHVELWHLTIPALIPNFRVIALDYLGHGHTDKPINIPYTFDDLSRFVKAFMDQMKIDQAHIVGHSLGGALAAKLALQAPQRVKSLVLLDSAGLGKELSVILRTMTVPILGEVLGKILTTPNFSRFEETWRASLVNSSMVSTDYVRATWEYSRQPDLGKVVLKILRQTAKFTGVRSSQYNPIVTGLPAIHQPTLVVWGKEDAVTPISHALNAVKFLPNARLELLDACGHNACLEKPDEFNRILLDFLRTDRESRVLEASGEPVIA